MSYVPIVLADNALDPLAMSKLPVVLTCNEDSPVAVFLDPFEINVSAPDLSAVL